MKIVYWYSDIFSNEFQNTLWFEIEFTCFEIGNKKIEM